MSGTQVTLLLFKGLVRSALSSPDFYRAPCISSVIPLSPFEAWLSAITIDICVVERPTRAIKALRTAYLTRTRSMLVQRKHHIVRNGAQRSLRTVVTGTPQH